MIKRLRPKYSDDELAQLYQTPHEHSKFPDHVLRVGETIKLGERLLDQWDEVGADLSCGDGAILEALQLRVKIFGDFAEGSYDFCGPLDETIEKIPFVDVFVLCETIEHLDDPIGILKKIRNKTKKLILSTPLTNQGWVDENPEHYWSWDKSGLGKLLKESKFQPREYTETNPSVGYRFQIWGCI